MSLVERASERIVVKEVNAYSVREVSMVVSESQIVASLARRGTVERSNNNLADQIWALLLYIG